MTIYTAEQVRKIYIDAKNTKELRLERITTAIMNYATSNSDKRDVMLRVNSARENGIPSKSDIQWLNSNEGISAMKLLGYNIQPRRVMWGGGFGDPDEARESDPPEYDINVSW